jgi:hypothetical protein
LVPLPIILRLGVAAIVRLPNGAAAAADGNANGTGADDVGDADGPTLRSMPPRMFRFVSETSLVVAFIRTSGAVPPLPFPVPVLHILLMFGCRCTDDDNDVMLFVPLLVAPDFIAV